MDRFSDEARIILNSNVFLTIFEWFSRTGVQEFCGRYQFRDVPCWKCGCALRRWFIRSRGMVGADHALRWFSANSWFVMLDIAGNTWQAFGEHSGRGSQRGKRERVFPQLLQVIKKWQKSGLLDTYTADQKFQIIINSIICMEKSEFRKLKWISVIY